LNIGIYLLPPRLPPLLPVLRLPPPELPPDELRLGEEKLPVDLEGDEVLLLGAE